jgi:glutamine amidotransferase
MCELLGMSANVPTDIVFSFTGLMQRGGGTGPHRDGWGIGFYEGRGLRLFQDPAASVESEVARLVQRYPIKSETVIGHIRQANVGKVCPTPTPSSANSGGATGASRTTANWPASSRRRGSTGRWAIPTARRRSATC